MVLSGGGRGREVLLLEVGVFPGEIMKVIGGAVNLEITEI